MADEFGLDSIGQIHISVDDISRSVAFYRDVLGMKLLFEVPGQGMAFFDCGGVRLYLGKPERPEFRSNPLIYYRVASIQGAFEVMKSRGVDFEGDPHLVHKSETHELWMAGFKDHEGNNLVLMSEVTIG